MPIPLPETFVTKAKALFHGGATGGQVASILGMSKSVANKIRRPKYRKTTGKRMYQKKSGTRIASSPPDENEIAFVKVPGGFDCPGCETEVFVWPCPACLARNEK